jgi:hypothetical protein
MSVNFSGLEALDALIKAESGSGGLPSGDHTSLQKPKSNTVGGSADGGDLEATGGPGAPEAPNVGKGPGDPSVGGTKLSDDDDDEGLLSKAGPFYGPRGGKWADSQHTIPWQDHKETFKDRKLHMGAVYPALAFDHLFSGTEQAPYPAGTVVTFDRPVEVNGKSFEAGVWNGSDFVFSKKASLDSFSLAKRLEKDEVTVSVKTAKGRGKNREQLTYKSVTPARQREMVAHQMAQRTSQLRKGPADVRVKSADEQASDLVKSDDFYHGGAPQYGRPSIDLTSVQKCHWCEGTFAKSLTACPDCGAGQTVSRPLPVFVAAGPRQSLLRKSQANSQADVRVCDVQPVSVASGYGQIFRLPRD